MKPLLLCASLLALLLGYYELGYNPPFEATTRAGGGNTEARAGRRDRHRSISKSNFNSNYTSVSQSMADERALAQGGDSSWRFLVFADIHGMTSFSWGDLKHNKKTEHWTEQLRVLNHINENWGGELVVLPGDVASYGGVSLEDLMDDLGGDLSPEEAVYQAGRNCFNGTREIFKHAGYDTLIATVGDHEIGGNEGFRPFGKKSKLHTLPNARLAFGDGFNRNSKDEFIFQQPLFGNIPSRPLGTPYENTTFAHVHKNALFVTVDAFELVGDGESDYIDLENGFGGEGAVTCTVDGDGQHIDWFENILRGGSNDPSVNHIIVSAHLPIIQPARKVKCSGQFLDGGEESDFWRLMNEFNVDIYLAGEVHANTVTKTRYPDSDLIQIVSRGNRFNNFMTVDIDNDVIEVKIYNEYGDLPRWNAQYEESGSVTIDKTSSVTDISSSGMLELLEVDSEIISFDFEEIQPMGMTQVLGLRSLESLIATNVTIRGTRCERSIPNMGTFGAQYNAQVGNIALVEGRNGGHAAKFDVDSRMGIYGIGPFGAGEPISFGCWFETSESTKKMVLLHYANYWGKVVEKNISKDYFSLALDNGIPVIHTRPLTELKSLNTQNLADGQWHHIAISMPRKSCLVSELEVYIDGKIVETIVDTDHHIFQTTSGRLNVGGFGYSNTGFEDRYPRVDPYIGKIDDFSLFGRPINIDIDFFPSPAPSSSPSGLPSSSPFPSTLPTTIPSLSLNPTETPSSSPTISSAPTLSSQPTILPSESPSDAPSVSSFPSTSPSLAPSDLPSLSSMPSALPSAVPTLVPTLSTSPTTLPSISPTSNPTLSSFPSTLPTLLPSAEPSQSPSISISPTKTPSSNPSSMPTVSMFPTLSPSSSPTVSASPSRLPSNMPTISFAPSLSMLPTSYPSGVPSFEPTSRPSSVPSTMPSLLPSIVPTTIPSIIPTSQPSGTPTSQPSLSPTRDPTHMPSLSPSSIPTKSPTEGPSSAPSRSPSKFPTAEPTFVPTSIPSDTNSLKPSISLTVEPTVAPSLGPSHEPSDTPSHDPSHTPSHDPSDTPSHDPSDTPSNDPSHTPSHGPSLDPSHTPSVKRSNFPSSHPTPGDIGKKPSSSNIRSKSPPSETSITNLYRSSSQNFKKKGLERGLQFGLSLMAVIIVYYY